MFYCLFANQWQSINVVFLLPDFWKFSSCTVTLSDSGFQWKNTWQEGLENTITIQVLKVYHQTSWRRLCWPLAIGLMNIPGENFWFWTCKVCSCSAGHSGQTKFDMCKYYTLRLGLWCQGCTWYIVFFNFKMLLTIWHTQVLDNRK